MSEENSESEGSKAPDADANISNADSGAASEGEKAVADAVAANSGKPAEGEKDYSFVLDKYKTDGRSIEESIAEQAKGYNEIRQKMGAQTGAPEEYELKLSEELSEKINIDDFKDDPLLQDFREKAKELNINNDSFNELVGLYFNQQVADDGAMELHREEQKQILGSRADQRIKNIEDYAGFNFDAETQKKISDSLTSADAVMAFEAIIGKTRNAPQLQDEDAAGGGGGPTHAELQLMMVAKDEHGQPKMNDKAYRKMVDDHYDRMFGAEPHQQIVTI